MPIPRAMEHPDTSAVGGLYPSHLEPGPLVAVSSKPWLIRRVARRVVRAWIWFFGEEGFAGTESARHEEERGRSIRLTEVAVDAAKRLNSHRFSIHHGPALDLGEDEMVEVICETARILLLEAKVRARLAGREKA